MAEPWQPCSACKRVIPHGAIYWTCSVSTCNRERTRLVFCTVPCWDSHVGTLRHRDAWAVEARAPTLGAVSSAASAPVASPVPVARPAEAPRRVIATPAPAAAPTSAVGAGGAVDDDVLVVVSKVKKYIRDRSGMNCGDAVAEALSEHVRAVCDIAIRTAGADGRKTVLERDVPTAARRA